MPDPATIPQQKVIDAIESWGIDLDDVLSIHLHGQPRGGYLQIVRHRRGPDGQLLAAGGQPSTVTVVIGIERVVEPTTRKPATRWKRTAERCACGQVDHDLSEPCPAATGWDRHAIERIIDMVATIPQGASGDGDQLRALLADRDRIERDGSQR
jgi:hypothetical protein